jgi:hypothetical protein
VSGFRRLVKGCRHARLISLKREYTPGFTPRHAKSSPVEGSKLTPEMGLAA